MKFYIKKFPVNEAVLFNRADAVYNEFCDLRAADQESFWILGLDTEMKAVVKECIFLGGINSSVVDLRIVFKRLIYAGAASFICIHNHPSGNLTPSQEDNAITRRLLEGGRILGINLTDHIIIQQFSF
ncbi:MAG: JAB domain-containing protein [bacterium]